MCKNEAVRCGLEREKSDAGAARGLIPTHVKEAEWKHEVSSVHLVFPPKLEPCVFDLLPKYFSSRPKLFCVVTKHVRILFSQAPFSTYGFTLRASLHHTVSCTHFSHIFYTIGRDSKW